jgi:hypothetical protein
MMGSISAGGGKLRIALDIMAVIGFLISINSAVTHLDNSKGVASSAVF